MRTRLLVIVGSCLIVPAIGLLSGCPSGGGGGGGGGGNGDTISPDEAVVSTVPTDGITGVSPDAPLTISFARPAVADSLDGSVVPDVGFDVSWSADGMTLTVTADAPFEEGVEHTVTITDLQFTDGSRLSDPFSFSFTVRDADGSGGGGNGGTEAGDTMVLWTVGQTRLRGAVVHPCTVASDSGPEMTCDVQLTKSDLDDLKTLGANLIQASYPGLFNQQPPYGINETAQAYLDDLVAWAAEVDLYVVIAVRTGPGRNEAQITGFGEPLSTIWTDQAAHDAWVDMWRYMADRYADSPVVIGYDVMVEPHVNSLVDPNGNLPPTAFQQENAGTLADWNVFAAEISGAIRDVDSDTPIIISSLQWGSVDWFPALEPTGDSRTVYSLHAYDPDLYTHQDSPNADISYPSAVESDGETVMFDRDWLAQSFGPAIAFSETHDVPIYVGEYGAIRWLPGASEFVADQVALFEENGWNYTYYVWRGDEPSFNGFNMELGTDAASTAPVTPSSILEGHSGHWPENTFVDLTQGDSDSGTDENDVGSSLISPPANGKLYFGLFPGDETASGMEDEVSLNLVQSFEQAVGQQVAWVFFSHNWYRNRAFPTETVEWIRDTGAIPYVRLMLRSDGEQDHAEPVYNLPAILSGQFDADLEDWGAAAAEFGTPLLVEWGTEFNGEWFSWNGVWNGGGTTDDFGDPNTADGPERFVAAYQHIVDIMRGEDAHNITWVFHVNAPDVPDEEWNRFENYYPGHDYVDWLAISVYGAGTPMDTGIESFREQLDVEYDRLDALAADKPIIVAEMGSSANNAETAPEDWADAALTDLFNGRWPRIIGFAWWNEAWQNDDDPAHDTTMRVQDVPNLAALFQDQFERNSDKLQERIVGGALSAATP